MSFPWRTRVKEFCPKDKTATAISNPDGFGASWLEVCNKLSCTYTSKWLGIKDVYLQRTTQYTFTSALW